MLFRTQNHLLMFTFDVYRNKDFHSVKTNTLKEEIVAGRKSRESRENLFATLRQKPANIKCRETFQTLKVAYIKCRESL